MQVQVKIGMSISFMPGARIFSTVVPVPIALTTFTPTSGMASWCRRWPLTRKGREFADWVIIDGPGSGNLQADEMFVENKAYGMTGTLFGRGWDETSLMHCQIIKGRCDWQRQDLTEQEYNQLKAAGVPIKDLEASGSWFWRRYSYGKRDVTPQQLQEQIIKTFRKNGVIPTQVNMVGWSRGGISCHMLANAMANDAELKHISVNIFAIDPVPGLLNFQDNRVKLAANVKEYVAFYARDERSKGFACVIPQTASSTRTCVYPMPGRHATLVAMPLPTVPRGTRRWLSRG